VEVSVAVDSVEASEEEVSAVAVLREAGKSIVNLNSYQILESTLIK
jgi:hypothetical protein